MWMETIIFIVVSLICFLLYSWTKLLLDQDTLELLETEDLVLFLGKVSFLSVEFLNLFFFLYIFTYLIYLDKKH